jgi:hypothetical protein
MKITIGDLTAECGEYYDTVNQVVENYKRGKMVVVFSTTQDILVGRADLERLVATNKTEEDATCIYGIDTKAWDATDCPELCYAARQAYYLPHLPEAAGGVNEGTKQLDTLTSGQETMVQDFAALCKRLEPASQTNVGKRALIERTITRSAAWIQKHPHSLLLLACPVTEHGDQIAWTKIGPEQPEFRDVVTNRIRRGYLPLGLLSPPGTMNIMGDSVPPEYRADWVDFVKKESTIIALTLAGKLSEDVAWMDEAKKAETVNITTRGGKSLRFTLAEWLPNSDDKPN